MRLRIKSDGTARGTHVYAVDEDGTETEHEITGLSGVTWSVNVRTGRAHATLEIVDADIEADGELAQTNPTVNIRVEPMDDPSKVAATFERVISRLRKPDSDFLAG